MGSDHDQVGPDLGREVGNLVGDAAHADVGDGAQRRTLARLEEPPGLGNQAITHVIYDLGQRGVAIFGRDQLARLLVDYGDYMQLRVFGAMGD